jgi:hypothetical protein
VDYQVKLKSRIQTQPGSPILLKQTIITIIQLFMTGQKQKVSCICFSVKSNSFICLFTNIYYQTNSLEAMKLKFTRPLIYNFQWAPDRESHD